MTWLCKLSSEQNLRANETDDKKSCSISQVIILVKKLCGNVIISYIWANEDNRFFLERTNKHQVNERQNIIEIPLLIPSPIKFHPLWQGSSWHCGLPCKYWRSFEVLLSKFCAIRISRRYETQCNSCHLTLTDYIIRLQCITRAWFPDNSASEQELIISRTFFVGNLKLNLLWKINENLLKNSLCAVTAQFVL